VELLSPLDSPPLDDEPLVLDVEPSLLDDAPPLLSLLEVEGAIVPVDVDPVLTSVSLSSAPGSSEGHPRKNTAAIATNAGFSRRTGCSRMLSLCPQLGGPHAVLRGAHISGGRMRQWSW
jgi:hypothetical protein